MLRRPTTSPNGSTRSTASTRSAWQAAVEVLAELGPGLGRPFVDTLGGSRHRSMKELRPRGGHLRVLFAFDPRRTAVLLVGGDKTDRWERWYEGAIARADRLYDEHLADLRRSTP